MVKDGQLRAYILSEDGREITISRLFSYDVSMLSASCVMPDMQFNVMIEAEKDTTFWSIPACLFKNLVDESIAAANFANIGYISADLYQAQIEHVLQMMAPQMDSQMLEAMEDTMSDLPLMMFIYTLIYCFIFGTVLSAILSRNIPSRNPFETFNPDEQ